MSVTICKGKSSYAECLKAGSLRLRYDETEDCLQNPGNFDVYCLDLVVKESAFYRVQAFLAPDISKIKSPSLLYTRNNNQVGVHEGKELFHRRQQGAQMLSDLFQVTVEI